MKISKETIRLVSRENKIYCARESLNDNEIVIYIDKGRDRLVFVGNYDMTRCTADCSDTRLSRSDWQELSVDWFAIRLLVDEIAKQYADFNKVLAVETLSIEQITPFCHDCVPCTVKVLQAAVFDVESGKYTAKAISSNGAICMAVWDCNVQGDRDDDTLFVDFL